MNYRFYITNENNRVHINLSEIAYTTMQSDMDVFNCHSQSEYINCVFECFAEQSKASIHNQLLKNHEQLVNTLQHIDESVRNDVINIIQKQFENKLVKEANSYPKGIGFKIRVRNNNYELLCESLEAKYYHKNPDDEYAVAGKYIKAIVEEFTRLSYVEREYIYNIEKINTINAAIVNRKALKIALHSNGIENSTKTIYMQPYAIIPDKMNMYNYLIGYSYKQNTSEDKANKKVASLRISRIKSLRKLTEPAIINKQEILKLNNELLSRGVQFLLDDTVIVKVKLTNDGISMYNKRLHLRPQFISIENDIYTFKCTKRQAQYYFFSFGNNAKIIEPNDLAKTFKDMYEAALGEYT